MYVDGTPSDKDKSMTFNPRWFNCIQNTHCRREEVTCDYWFTFVNVLDAYTSEEEIEIPLVAIDDIGDEEEAIELGPKNKLVYVTYKLNVYGNL